MSRIFTLDGFYVGNTKSGKKNGQGKLTSSQIGTYSGQFFNDMMQGNGTMTYNNKTVQTGYWNNNTFW